MMMGHPGKKLLFMGQDFAQEREWNFKTGLDWHLCDDEGHRDVLTCFRKLLHLYSERPVLHNDNGGPVTCEWINSGDYNRNIFTFIRRNPWNYNNALIFVCNFAPVERVDMGVGAPLSGVYKRIFTTYPDANPLEIEAKEELCDGRKYKLIFNLRPYESCIFEVPYRETSEEEEEVAPVVEEVAPAAEEVAPAVEEVAPAAEVEAPCRESGVEDAVDSATETPEAEPAAVGEPAKKPVKRPVNKVVKRVVKRKIVKK